MRNHEMYAYDCEKCTNRAVNMKGDTICGSLVKSRGMPIHVDDIGNKTYQCICDDYTLIPQQMILWEGI